MLQRGRQIGVDYVILKNVNLQSCCKVAVQHDCTHKFRDSDENYERVVFDRFGSDRDGGS